MKNNYLRKVFFKIWLRASSTHLFKSAWTWIKKDDGTGIPPPLLRPALMYQHELARVVDILAFSFNQGVWLQGLSHYAPFEGILIMKNMLISPTQAGQISYVIGMAAKMAQASGSMVNLEIDGRELKAFPTSDQFQAVIDVIDSGNIFSNPELEILPDQKTIKS